MIEIYNTILYRPLFNLLVFLYNTVSFQDIGIAIILLTVIIKLALYPLSVKSIKGQKALQELQPKMEEIKRKYKNSKEQLGKAMMELYKKEKISPMSSCLPLLIQFPFLIAVYHVFRAGFKPESLDMLYGFVANPGAINPIAFGFLNLAEKNIVLAVLAGAAQFWSSKMLISKKQPNVPGAKDEGMSAMMNKQMLYFMPAITIFIGAGLPGGLTFYWFLTTLLTAFQQLYIFKKHGGDDVKIQVPESVKPAQAEEKKEIENK
ncbi:MAG: YidC/Oxa1 family membrane protein insertase [Candidatus Kuenenbacteria bacterium]